MSSAPQSQEFTMNRSGHPLVRSTRAGRGISTADANTSPSDTKNSEGPFEHLISSIVSRSASCKTIFSFVTLYLPTSQPLRLYDTRSQGII